MGDMPHFCALAVQFLSDPGVPGVRSMGPVLSNSLTEPPFANLTDVTLADEDTNSILTYNATRAIQGNVPMQIIQSGCQLGHSKAMWQCIFET